MWWSINPWRARRAQQFLEGLRAGQQRQLGDQWSAFEPQWCPAGGFEWRAIRHVVRTVAARPSEIDESMANTYGFRLERQIFRRQLRVLDLVPDHDEDEGWLRLRERWRREVGAALGCQDMRLKGELLGAVCSPFFFVKLGVEISPLWRVAYWHFAEQGWRGVLNLWKDRAR